MRFDNRLIAVILAVLLVIVTSPATLATVSGQRTFDTVYAEMYGTVPIPNEEPQIMPLSVPTGTQYVPYRASLPRSIPSMESAYWIVSGSLPEGLSMSESGEITGIPLELGVFRLEILQSNLMMNTTHDCTLSVFSRMYADVEEENPPGYGFVETEGDDGRIHDQHVSSAAELVDQVMHCEGPYYQFRNLYLDARVLTRDVEYFAVEGSTKITLLAETISAEGGGTHTVAAEFETDAGETVYTVQNYTVTGIASTEVRVSIMGSPVIWTDSEPYIDMNNRTMTPFRIIGEELGLTISWNGSSREASFSDGEKTITFPIGDLQATTSTGKTIDMDTSAVIVNGRTYAPVRYLAEFFGYNVSWDRASRTVLIS